MDNQFTLLRVRRFLPLFLTQVFNSFNDNFFKTALIVLISYYFFDKFPINIQLLIIVACGIFILPAFLFSSFAGQLASKYNQKNLLQFLSIAKIGAVLVAILGFYINSTLLLLLALFLLGFKAALYSPVKFSILTGHLDQKEWIAGNALLQTGSFISILFGILIGGFLATFPINPFWISFITLSIAVLALLASCYVPQTHHELQNIKISKRFFNETWKMLQHNATDKDIFFCLLAIAWFWFICTIYLTQFPAYTNEVLRAKPAIIAFLLFFFASGIAVGTLLCQRLLRGKIEATYVPIAAIGISFFAMDLVWGSGTFLGTIDSFSMSQFLFSLDGLRVLMDLLLLGACGGIYIVPLYAMLQQNSNSNPLTLACSNFLNATFMASAVIVTVIMLCLGFSIMQLFLTVAFVNLLVALLICNLLPEALVKSFLIWIFKTLYRAEVKGMENYLNAGNRVLIVANHTSFLDAALLAALLPDRLTFAINTHIAQRWWVKYFLKIVNTYPVDPTNALAAKSLIEYLRLDHRVVIFPEGRITVTGSLMRIYEGPGLIADKAKAALLPIRIDGAQYTRFSYLRDKLKLRWFPKITLTVLEARKFDFPPDISGRMRRELVSRSLYDIMTDTLFYSSNINETLFQSLIYAKTVHGKKHIVLEDIERKPMNFQRLILGSLILGRHIAKMTEKKEYVGILLPNSVANVLTFFALQAFHRIPAMLNFTTGIKNLLAACKTAELRFILTSRKFVELANLESITAELSKHGYQLIYLEDVRQNISLLEKLFGKVISFFPLLYYRCINNIRQTNQQAMSDEPCVILYTSGSEGSPKGVVLSHKNLQANRFQLIARVDFGPRDKIFNSLPMFHSFGLNTATLLPIICGMRVFMYPSPLHYRIVPELCYDTGSTIFFGTDTFLSNYAKYAHPYNFYSVRYIFAGAEKLRDETRRLWMNKFGIRIMEGYGATEASPAISTNTSMQYKSGSVGRILPGIHCKLLPVEGIQEGGRLVVSGPNVMLGYMHPEAPLKLVPPDNGWHDTGDIVNIDDEGFLTIKGRAKRFAKIAGEMVSLTAIEEEIYTLWPNYQHAVLSQADERKGEVIILITNHPEAKLGTLIEHFKKRGVAEIFLPRKTLPMKELPVLGSGKINYPALNEMMMTQ